MTQTKTHQMILCALFAALIAIGAFIKIPIPLLAFTLQFLFANLAGILLGAKGGRNAVLIYILLGLMGLPIFSEGGGIGYIFKPSFGYLLGFAVGAYQTGAFLKHKKGTVKNILLAGLWGLFFVYAIGLLYYYGMMRWYLKDPMAVGKLLYYCFLLPLPGDLFLCVLSAFLGKRLWYIWRRTPYECNRLDA